MRILFAGGGTAGHINPAIAVAKYMLKRESNCEILFVGTMSGLEKELVPKEGFDIEYIDVLGFKRSLSLKNLAAVAKVFGAYGQSRRIIKSFKPDVVMGTGGYVSGPVLAAASRMKIPTIIHEQNVSPGLTSKLLSGMVDTVCISFEQSRKNFKKVKNLVFTGNPLREELFTITKDEAKKQLGLDKRPYIVAFGGSLGARRLNEALLELIVKYRDKDDFQMLLATGSGQYVEVMQSLCENGIAAENMTNIKVVPYIHNMAQIMNAADLVIARAGAITISEINALGKASILIPSPNVTDNHQEYNARALEESGAAIVIIESELSNNSLAKSVRKLLDDKDLLGKMSKNSEKMGVKNGTKKIYDTIKTVIVNT